MRGRSGWLVLALLGLAATGLVLLQRGAAEDSPYHSSFSDGRNGTSALRQLAQVLGHPTTRLDSEFSLPDGGGTLFVFSPASHFSGAEVALLKSWMESGGIVVYADDNLDRRIGLAFDLHKTSLPVATDAHPATPALAGVRFVTTNSLGPQYAATPAQAILLRGKVGRESVIEEKVGRGRLIALAAPQMLANAWLQVADNAILAGDLLSLTPGPILFDEYHHRLDGNDPAAHGDWTSGPLGLGLFWGTMAIFIALLIRGRAFGPRLALAPTGPRSTAEYAFAVGHLLRRAGGRSLALQLLTDATRRRLAARMGVGADLPTARLADVLGRRAPELGNEFAQARAAAATPVRSEAGLLRIARRLHDLAYPHAGGPVNSREDK